VVPLSNGDAVKVNHRLYYAKIGASHPKRKVLRMTWLFASYVDVSIKGQFFIKEARVKGHLEQGKRVVKSEQAD